MPRATLVLLPCLLVSCAKSPPPAAPPAPPPNPLHTVTPEGLAIDDLSLGQGEPCSPRATVTINFTAAFKDGRIYDSSDLRRRPITFTLNDPGLIRGLRQGIPGMRPGGTRRLAIPWPLAYGKPGRDPIPPETDLVFEIHLLEVRD